uniref:Uncharacterized protein n=1 Tax=Rhizophora mucronata TaxID=61149 RepID=A0A2P2NSY4_RHIMU
MEFLIDKIKILKYFQKSTNIAICGGCAMCFVVLPLDFLQGSLTC